MFSQSASRRRALAGLVGGALAAVASTGEAKRRHHRHNKANDAPKPGNSDCAHFCTTVFAPGPRRGQCISDAAHGNGLCVLCKADPSNLCGATCCQPPDTCGGGGTSGVCGHCTPNCTRKCGGVDDGCGGACAGACETGRICLSNGTCAVPCPNGGSDCQAAGCGNRCIVTGQGPVGGLDNVAGGCSSNAQCPVGRACISGVICEIAC